MNELALFIQNYRELRGLSRRRLAELAGISHTEVHRLERGERRNPSPPLLRSLAGALEVPYDDIMRAAGYLPEAETQLAAHVEGLSDLSTEELREVQKYIDFLRQTRGT